MSRLMLDWPASYERLAREVVTKEVAVVPSANHCGTWFLLGFLGEHPQTADIVDLPAVLARNSLNPRAVVHFHVGGAPPLWDAFDGLRATGRVVVPLRDPLLCLCTRQARHPFLDHRYIVEGFRRFAESGDGVTFFPVDADIADRPSVLRATLSVLGLEEDPSHVDLWIRNWKPRNSIGYDTAEKVWYRDSNVPALRASIGPELDYLLESRDVLVPFLKARGYKKMSWWNW